MIDTPDHTPTREKLVTTAFERLPTAKKLEVFEDILGILTEDLSRLNDPNLEDQTGTLGDIFFNITMRIDEIATVYGLDPE